MSRIISANKLNRFWKNGVMPIKNNLNNKIKTKADLMANTVEGYVPDALAVKEGLKEINDSLDKVNSSTFLNPRALADHVLTSDSQYYVTGTYLNISICATIGTITEGGWTEIAELVSPDLVVMTTPFDAILRDRRVGSFDTLHIRDGQFTDGNKLRIYLNTGDSGRSFRINITVPYRYNN